MGKYIIEDIPLKKEILEMFIKLLNLGEDITLVSLPRNFRTILSSKLQDESERSKLSINSENKLFVVIDASLDLEMIINMMNEFLSNFSSKEGVSNKLRDITQTKKVTFVFDNFNFKNAQLLSFIQSLRTISLKSIQFIFMPIASEFYSSKSDTSRFGLAFRNIIQLPYMGKNEALEWIDTASLQYGKVTSKVKELIWEFCGGVPSLIKHFLRLSQRTSNFNEVLKSEETQQRVEHFWNNFSAEEQNVIKQLTITNESKSSPEVLNYLKDLNLVGNDNKVIGKWINYVIEAKGDKKIEVKGEKLFWESIDITDKFTPNEQKVLVNLIAKLQLTRDEVSKLIWGEHANASYSDYAIDQLVSRLRKKMTNLGLDAKSIKTIKKIGFKFYSD